LKEKAGLNKTNVNKNETNFLAHDLYRLLTPRFVDELLLPLLH
jgi:hypothetical protein